MVTTTAAGDSVPSAPITVTPDVAFPSRRVPDPPVATAPDPLDGAIRARGVASAFDGGSPILGYRADALDAGGVVRGTCWIDVVTNPTADSCIVYGLNNNEPYIVVGYAFNGYGSSLESADSPPATPTVAERPTPPPTPNPIPDPIKPEPIIEFDLTGGHTVDFEVFSYVAVPQGQVEIRTNVGDPSGSDVRFRGGLVAGRFVPFDPPSTFKLDIENPVAQRTIKIESTAGNAVSTAVVQVNATGASAVKAWVTQ